MSFGLNDREWVEPEEPDPNLHFCADCKHCKDVDCGVTWYYCARDAELALRDAKSPEEVFRAYTGAWLDIDEGADYCQYFEQG